MRVSLNEIKQYIDFELPPVGELVKRINEQLGGVENVIDFGDIYKDAVIVKVVSCDKHPNADKLHVCLVDDAGAVKDVERGDDGLVKVVCGAPNVHAGMLAVWLPPKSVVPSTYHDDEPFILGARELRGEMSNGMLASPKELGLGDSHDGILEIDASEWKPNNVEIKPGASFAAAYGLDDQIIDIENKMFTHRPDLFGQLGVAREIAGISGHAFASPEWYKAFPKFNGGSGLELTVTNDASEKVPRFMAVAIKDVTVRPSPIWLQAELVRLGGKPINNIVDVTNYIMLLTAQPTHAYDYDKLRGHKLGARLASKGEEAELLNGKTYELTEDDIVIVDGEGIVGLGGIMGGGNSEVSNETKNVVLEVANFDMYTIRKSSMRHGLFTDAVTRFNKGQSPLQNPYVLGLLMKSVLDVAGGTLASDIADIRGEFTDEQEVKTTADFINSRLGLSLDAQEIETLLTNVEFSVETSADHSFKAPFWRTDIELPEDIVEEVGRLYGFDKLPRELPRRSIAPSSRTPLLETKRSVRHILKQSGANEVLTYSFVHEKLLKNAEQNAEHAFVLSNALSPDLQYYRLSLTPSLLDKIHMNLKAGYERFALFELGKTHYKGEMDPNEPDVPNEDNQVSLVIAYADKKAPEGAAYFHAKRYLEQIVNLNDYELVPLKGFDLKTDEWGAQLTSAYEPSRSAVVVKDKQIWGVVGEFKSTVKRAFKLPAFAAGFEVHMDIVSVDMTAYEPLSRFPSVTQDISIRVKNETTFEQVQSAVRSAVESLDSDYKVKYEPTVVYRPESGNETTTTFRLTVTSHEGTLSDKDVRPIVDAVEAVVKDKLSGRIV